MKIKGRPLRDRLLVIRTYDPSEDLEILGNIYENPELMDKE